MFFADAAHLPVLQNMFAFPPRRHYAEREEIDKCAGVLQCAAGDSILRRTVVGDQMKDVVAYLKARLAECARRPDLHANTIQAYTSLLSLAESRPGDYVREAGDMFAVVKAENLDRFSNYASLYERLGMKGCADAYRVALDAVNRSTGYADINRNITKAQTAITDALNRESRWRDNMMVLVGKLFEYRVEVGDRKSAARDAVKAAWAALREIDPDVSWGGISASPKSRRFLYYDDERMALIGRWLGEVVS
jgi:hypothetical protein